MAVKPAITRPSRAKAFGLPARRNLGTPRGSAGDTNLAARKQQAVAYSPKPFPDSSR
jgi:hypothetical protein